MVMNSHVKKHLLSQPLFHDLPVTSWHVTSWECIPNRRAILRKRKKSAIWTLWLLHTTVTIVSIVQTTWKPMRHHNHLSFQSIYIHSNIKKHLFTDISHILVINSTALSTGNNTSSQCRDNPKPNLNITG